MCVVCGARARAYEERGDAGAVLLMKRSEEVSLSHTKERHTKGKSENFLLLKAHAGLPFIDPLFLFAAADR